MADAVIINKVSSLERCLNRIKEDYLGHEQDFQFNFMRQDAIVLNLQRACEISIDLANHLVKEKQLGVPQNSRQPFELLSNAGLLEPVLAQRLMNMIGFRNIAVHDYQKLDLSIVESIIEKHLHDFREFSTLALKFV